MSQTVQFFAIPLRTGSTEVSIPSSASRVHDAQISEGQIVFSASPCYLNDRNRRREVIVIRAEKEWPDGFEMAGTIYHNDKTLTVFVKLEN